MKPTLEELVYLVTMNPAFQATLTQFPETYAHLSDEEQAQLAEALVAKHTASTEDIGLDQRRTKFGGEGDTGDQGSWPNTPFTS